MKILLLTLFALITLNQCIADLDSEWEEFKQQYRRNYNIEEDAFRKDIFAKTLKKVEDHQKKFEFGLTTFEIGINNFADMSDSEYALKMDRGVLKGEFGRAAFAQNFTARTIPDSVNWVEYGYKNPIINQGGCGSCYSFAATAALEGQYFIKHGELIQLSQQELIDCTKEFGNLGCHGGWQRNVYTYMMERNGLGYLGSNPYTGKEEDKCTKGEPRITISTFYEIPSGDEEALKQAVATVGPVPIDMDSTLDTFKYYKGGLFYDASCNPNSLTHAIAVVGYGTMSNGEQYWLIRNSWGDWWGENGYIYMARNRNNHCGVATRAVYPIVN